MTKPKPASELTTEGAMRRLFPKEVRAYLKAAVKEANDKPIGRRRGGTVLNLSVKFKDGSWSPVTAEELLIRLDAYDQEYVRAVESDGHIVIDHNGEIIYRAPVEEP